jgi:hypothetical protein
VDVPIRGGDKSAPEHQDGDTSYNPFPTDVYYPGNLVQEDYMEVRNFICSDKAASSNRGQKYHGFEFMKVFIAEMVQEDPVKRPTMDEVVARFPRSRVGSVHGSYAPAWPTRRKYSTSKCGEQSDVGTEQSATDSAARQRFPIHSDRPNTTIYVFAFLLSHAPFLYEADLPLSSLLIFLVKGQNHNASYYSSTILYIPASINRVFGDMTRLIGLLCKIRKGSVPTSHN